jgi:hypothetical protein
MVGQAVLCCAGGVSNCILLLDGTPWCCSLTIACIDVNTLRVGLAEVGGPRTRALHCIPAQTASGCSGMS